MHSLFKSSIAKVPIINSNNAVVFMKKVFLLCFSTFLQSFYQQPQSSGKLGE